MRPNDSKDSRGQSVPMDQLAPQRQSQPGRGVDRGRQRRCSRQRRRRLVAFRGAGFFTSTTAGVVLPTYSRRRRGCQQQPSHSRWIAETKSRRKKQTLVDFLDGETGGASGASAWRHRGGGNIVAMGRGRGRNGGWMKSGDERGEIMPGRRVETIRRGVQRGKRHVLRGKRDKG